MVIFDDKMIAGVKGHKYAYIDTSPLSNVVMHPFWNYSVNFFPKCVAPNLLTVLGFSCTVLNFLLLVYYDSDLRTYTNVPDIIWLVSAFLVFLAHFLDGIDGKQARRLGMSSPLGELLDHCCDAWTASLLPGIMLSLFSGNVSTKTLFTVHWIIGASFLISHWEKSITGVLYLPWSYDLAQVFAVILFILTFLFSPSIWIMPLPIIKMNTIELVPYVAHGVFWSLSLPISVVNVVLSVKEGRTRWPSALNLIRPLIANFFAFVLSLIWMLYSPTKIMDTSPRLFLFCVGTLSAHATTRIIICAVAKKEATMWFDLLTLYALVVFSLCFGLPPVTAVRIEFASLQLLTICITYFHLRYAKNVILELCEALNVKAFTV